MKDSNSLGWAGIVRLGLVQASLGAVVVLVTSTLNRVMVVELGLPALVPGLLVALHYAVQVARPRMGHGSDVGGRRTPWILGGMAMLSLGGLGAALATALMASSRAAGLALAALAFTMVGLGVSAAGTSLLVLLAKRVQEQRRAAAAAVVWLMMIVGFAVTAGTAGHFLDPFSPRRLVAVSAVVSAIAMLIALLALRGIEGREGPLQAAAAGRAPAARFGEALAQAWAEPQARLLTIFIFVSMLAYSAQELILEPFAGSVFGLTPGQTTSLSGVQHSGVLVGMLFAALAGRRIRGVGFGSLRVWTAGGCIASAVALLGLVFAGLAGPGYPLRGNVFLMGMANGVFSISAIGSMMSLAGAGQGSREGVRMGLWGAAQAIAFAVGGVVGTGLSDLARSLLGHPGQAYGCVFFVEAVLFVVAAAMAGKVRAGQPDEGGRGAASPRACGLELAQPSAGRAG